MSRTHLGGGGGKRRFTDAEEAQIVEEVTQNRPERHKHGLQIIKEKNLNCSEFTLQKILYKYYQKSNPFLLDRF